MLCVDTGGKVFQQVIAPFSARVAKALTDPKRPVVKGCVPANLVTTPATLVIGSQPQLQPPPPAAKSAMAAQSAASVAVQSAPDTAAQSAASVAIESAPTAAVQSAPSVAKTGGISALAAPPLTPLVHPVSVQSGQQSAAAAQASETQAVEAAKPAGAAAQTVLQSSSKPAAPTVSTPATLVLAAGRKLRAAASHVLPVRSFA